MKFIYDFIRLWIYWGDYKEAWQDAKFMNDKKIQKELIGILLKLKEWEPNRKYKIRAKIRKVYSGDPNPPLDLEL